VSGDTISVIVPVFNAAAYLAEALQSVLAQTRPADEIIVVDDGSTDDSAAAARRFDSHLRYERQPHAGAGAARNRGVAVAQSSLLAFLDADDLWMPDKLALQTEALSAMPSLEAVFAHLEHFRSPDLPPERAARMACPDDPMPCTTAVAMLIRRTAFDRVGGFETSRTIGEVIEWYMRARSVGLVERMLPQTLIRRRIHAGNTGVLRATERSGYVAVARAVLERRRRAKTQ
jgi:glycosyltransferase involved in cell wall biosynthesis